MPAAAANAALAGMAAKGRAGQDTRCSSGRSHRPGCAAHQWGVTLPRLCSARCTSCVTGARARARAAGGYDSPHARAAARAEGALAGAADAALAEQAAKARLALAADHFNRDHRKGFQFLQARPPRAWALLSQVPRSCRAPPHPRPQAGLPAPARRAARAAPARAPRSCPAPPHPRQQAGLPAPARRAARAAPARAPRSCRAPPHPRPQAGLPAPARRAARAAPARAPRSCRAPPHPRPQAGLPVPARRAARAAPARAPRSCPAPPHPRQQAGLPAPARRAARAWLAQAPAPLGRRRPGPRCRAGAGAGAAGRGAGRGRGGALPAPLPGPEQGHHRRAAGRERGLLSGGARRVHRHVRLRRCARLSSPSWLKQAVDPTCLSAPKGARTQSLPSFAGQPDEGRAQRWLSTGRASRLADRQWRAVQARLPAAAAQTAGQGGDVLLHLEAVWFGPARSGLKGDMTDGACERALLACGGQSC